MDQRQFEIILKPCGWEDVIRARMGARRAPIKAHTYRRKWESFSRPVLLSCGEKNEEFVVKGRHAGRAIVNEHVVGRLGALLEAPVPRIEIIEVPKDLIDAESELGHLVPGLAHGSQWIPDCSDRQWVQASDLKENRSRFAALAVLYGWVRANDHQLIYSNADPRLVHSVDHGHFFPSGPDWRIQDLREADPACPDRMLVEACQLTEEELERARQSLARIDAEAIADIVAGPPDEWGISMGERVEVAIYLWKRRDQLLC